MAGAGLSRFRKPLHPARPGGAAVPLGASPCTGLLWNMPPRMEVRLSREMRLIDITMIGVGAMIGAGIFVLTGIAAGVAGPGADPGLRCSTGWWRSLTAMAYAELGSAFHDAGGGYLWVKECSARPERLPQRLDVAGSPTRWPARSMPWASAPISGWCWPPSGAPRSDLGFMTAGEVARGARRDRSSPAINYRGRLRGREGRQRGDHRQGRSSSAFVVVGLWRDGRQARTGRRRSHAVLCPRAGRRVRRDGADLHRLRGL